jgi:pyruvate dehydrogenase E1 component beta subunit
MPVTSRTFAILSAIDTEMKSNPNMVYSEQCAAPSGARADGKTINVLAEFGVDRILSRMGQVIEEEWMCGSTLFYSFSVNNNGTGIPACVQTPGMTQMYNFELMGDVAGRAAYMMGGCTNWPSPPMVLYQSGASRSNDAVHGQCGTEDAFATQPGVVVCAPHLVYDAKGMMTSLLRGSRPAYYINYSTQSSADIPDEAYLVPIGKSAILKEGKDLTIAAYGPAHTEVTKAVDELAKAGIAAEYFDVRTLKPFDEDALVASVKKTGRLLTVSWGYYTQGFGSHMLAVAAQAVPGFKCRIISWSDCPNSGTPAMIAWQKPDSPKIVDAAQKLMKL